jgi:altronate dehydratase large subunit
VVDVLAYGEVPAKTGLHFMAGPAPAVESITGLASGGCQICLFSTGVGNPIGHQVTTVVKVSGNRNTLSSMPENIDFDVSGILEKDESIEAVGERLLDYVLAVCSGEQTTSELLDTRESAISRFGISM